MPTSKARADSIQPIIPAVSPETWKALLAAADEFNRLAPWKWMHDSHVIGLRHPVTNEILLGSILGRLRSVFALLVYRHDAGRRWLLNTILNDGDPGGLEGEDTALEQDLVKAEFVRKRELVAEDKAVLAAAGYAPAASRGYVWPQFRSLVPGGFPWHVTQAEVEILLFALPRAAAVARLMQRQPHVWDDHCDGEIAFVPADFDPAAGELRADRIDWQPMLPPPEPVPEAVVFEAAVLARLLKLEPAGGFHLELDLAYAPFPLAAEAHPYFPKLAMAVDRASGFVAGIHLAGVGDRDGAGALGTVLRDALTQLGQRPEGLRVQRTRVAAMLRTVASQLHLPVVCDDELAALNFARQSMQEHFATMR